MKNVALLLLLSSSTITNVLAQTVSTFANVGINPRGIAFVGSGNLFVANSGNNSISKITPGGVVNNSYITGVRPNAISFDSVGNMYVSDSTQSIRKYSSNGILLNETFGGQLGFYPYGIKFDTMDTLYVYASNGNVRRISSDGVLDTTPFVTGLTNNLGGLSFDLDGNLYVANYTTNVILKVTPAGNVSVFASGFNGPVDVVVDCIGTLFVSNYVGNSISKVTPQGVVSIYANGLNFPHGLALDTFGNLYVSNSGSNAVSKIEPQSGIFDSNFVDFVVDFYFSTQALLVMDQKLVILDVILLQKDLQPLFYFHLLQKVNKTKQNKLKIYFSKITPLF